MVCNYEVFCLEDPKLEEKLEKFKPMVVILPVEKKKEKLLKLFLSGVIEEPDLVKNLMLMGGLLSSFILDIKRVAVMCRKRNFALVGIDATVDNLIDEVEKKLNIKDKTGVIEALKLWLMGNTGPYLRFASRISELLFFLPPSIKGPVVSSILKLYGALANAVPGDQYDVVYAVSKTKEILSGKIVEVFRKFCKKNIRIVIVVPAFLLDDVKISVAEGV